MKIFITRQIPDVGIKMLQDKGFQVDVGPEEPPPREYLLEKIKGADAVLSILTEKINAEAMDAAGPQLKVVANYAVGFDNINVEEAKKRGIQITNTPGVLTEAVAEHTIAILFAVAERIVEADEYVRRGKFKSWGPKLLLGIDIRAKTLGIVGLGRIGCEVAKRMRDGFELKVIYYDIKRNEELEKQYNIEYRSFDDLLKESDFVSIHVPLLDSTRHMINAEKLKLMKKSAVLINTSRGPVIDESALVYALKSGQIFGAGLDVFEFEPQLTQGLIELDNVVLTPHIASATLETRNKMAEMAAQNIIEVLEGRKPINPVY